MSRKKPRQEISIIRSSAAEYLTFVAATGDDARSIEMRYEDENIWLTQKMMATLYDVTIPAINQHLKRIFGDGELAPSATTKKYLIVQTEGSREVSREVEHYNLQTIIAVDSRSTIRVQCNFASGQGRSSRTTPSRAGRWMWSA